MQASVPDFVSQLWRKSGKKAWEDLHVRWCHCGSIGSSVYSHLNLVSPALVLTINTNKFSSVLGGRPWQLFLIERVSGCWVYKPGTIQSVPPIQLQNEIGAIVPGYYRKYCTEMKEIFL